MEKEKESAKHSSGMDEEDQLKAAWAQLTLVQGFFARIDTKLSVILGLNLGMLAMLSTRLPKVGELTIIQGIALALCIVPLAVSLYNLYHGAFPNTQGGSDSLVFFGRIANMLESDFLVSTTTRTKSELNQDLLAQVWRNSKILSTKFQALQRAYQALLVAAVPWLIALAFLTSK